MHITVCKIKPRDYGEEAEGFSWMEQDFSLSEHQYGCTYTLKEKVCEEPIVMGSWVCWICQTCLHFLTIQTVSLWAIKFSLCQADNSDSNWPSASATADVRLISLSFRCLRVRCVIEATNLVTTSSENSDKPLICSAFKGDNWGSDWQSASAAWTTLF